MYLKSEYLRSIIYPPLLMWFLSRLLIVIVALFIVPIAAQNQAIAQLILPGISIPIDSPYNQFGWWDRFFAWDSIWYYQIVHSGYSYADNTQQHSVAFFPLYPFLIWLTMGLGVPFSIAALAINNLAFLGALILLHNWVKQRYNPHIAWWAIAFLAWCPYSIYSTVIYTEGLFLLFTTAALRAFDRRHYTLAGIWGGFATATRITGVALIPAIIITSFLEKRPRKAYFASIITAMGLGFYCIYQYFVFSEPFAFLKAQRGWRTSTGFAFSGWWQMLRQVFWGTENTVAGNIQNLTYPLLLITTISLCILLWRMRNRINSHILNYTLAIVWMWIWISTRAPLPGNIFSRDPSLKLALIFGGLVLLLMVRSQLPLIAFTYALCSYGIILNTGLSASVERYVYGIVSMAVVFAVLGARNQRLGYFFIGFFSLVLSIFTVQFALNQWLS